MGTFIWPGRAPQEACQHCINKAVLVGMVHRFTIPVEYDKAYISDRMALNDESSPP